MMASVKSWDTNLEEDPDTIKDIFLKFLLNIYGNFKEEQEQEEQVIIDNQKT